MNTWTYHKGGVLSRWSDEDGKRVYYGRFTEPDGRRWRVARPALKM
jgi:hypothetical protein